MIFDLLITIHYYSDIDTRLYLEKIYKFKKTYKLKPNDFLLPLIQPEKRQSFFVVELENLSIFYFENGNRWPAWKIRCHGLYELDCNTNTWRIFS